MEMLIKSIYFVLILCRYYFILYTYLYFAGKQSIIRDFYCTGGLPADWPTFCCRQFFGIRFSSFAEATLGEN